MSTLRAPSLIALLFLGVATSAQWSSDATANLAVADRPGEQTQPKLAVRGDGGFYLAWFDNDPAGSPAFGYDVYLQRFDSAGNEQWAHNGILVADRGFSSTVDYDLAVDTAGNALLAFNDDRPGTDQITAAKVDPAGNLAWGTSGVQLTSTTDFVANPKITGTSDGNIVAAWIQGSGVHVRKLDPSGAALWGADVVLAPGTGTYSSADLDASDAGACILSIVRGGSFSTPRHLLAQKLDPNGAPLWGASPVVVFDGGSLQFGNFPDFEGDGNGGAVFAWYSASPALECFVQRVNAAGSELFPHDGVAVSSAPAEVRVSPAVCYEPASQSTYVVYVAQNTLQSQSGVSGQKVDAAGVRQWGASGKVIVPLGAGSIVNLESLSLGSRIAAFWIASPSFGQDVGRRALLDDAGTIVVPAGVFASTPSVKFRLAAEKSAYGHSILAWRDERGADPDLYVQDVLPTGALGGLAATVFRNGTGVNTAFYSRLSDPRLGSVWGTSVSHAHHPGANSTLIVGRSAPSTGPIVGPGQLLVSGTLMFTHFVPSSGSADVHAVPIPVNIVFVGLTLYSQAVILGGGLELGNALDVTVGL